MKEKWVFWLEELAKEDDKLVGKKCANLAEMAKMGLSVPSGFALSLQAYEIFLEGTELRREIEAQITGYEENLKSIRELNKLSYDLSQLVESREMPDEMEAIILSYYEELGKRRGKSEIAVSIRSSGVVSRPGLYTTFLNVKGGDEVLRKIKGVWASTFSSYALSCRKHKGEPLDKRSIGVGVIEMTLARSAGIAFSADPVSGDTSKIIVEANWGLGGSVVGGEVTPDRWVLDKDTLEIRVKKAGEKQKMLVPSEVGVSEQEVPSRKKKVYCLSEQEAKEIGRLVRLLENHYQTPQDVEWAVEEGGKVVLLQTRPVPKPLKSPLDRIIDLEVNWITR